MRERLHLHTELRSGAGEVLGLTHRQLACERHALCAEARSRTDARLAVRVHLRGDVDARVGKCAGDLRCEPEVLDDEGIGSSAIRLAGALERIARLVGKDHRVQRDVDTYAAHMGVGAGVAQRVEGEVLGAAAGVEVLETEVDGIGACRHGSMQRRHAPCGSKQFDCLSSHTYSDAAFSSAALSLAMPSSYVDWILAMRSS